jgi:hypothetical protein
LIHQKLGKSLSIANFLPYFFSDAIVSQVLDELGLQLTDQLSGKLFSMVE